MIVFKEKKYMMIQQLIRISNCSLFKRYDKEKKICEETLNKWDYYAYYDFDVDNEMHKNMIYLYLFEACYCLKEYEEASRYEEIIRRVNNKSLDNEIENIKKNREKK